MDNFSQFPDMPGSGGGSPSGPQPPHWLESVRAAGEKFKALPRKTQAIVLGVVFVLLMALFSGGEKKKAPGPQFQADTASAKVGVNGSTSGVSGTAAGFGEASDKEALVSAFVTQQRVALGEQQKRIDEQMKMLGDQKAVLEAQRQEAQADAEAQKQQFEELRAAMTDQLAGIQQAVQGAGYQGAAPQGAAPMQEAAAAQAAKQKGFRVIALSGGGGNGVSPRNALFQSVSRPVSERLRDLEEAEADARVQPFVPPLGFIKGTMLNGVDALAGSGKAVPALVRLSGVYKTAMNSTVNLDGCMALVEFEGDISTERAVGKPSRMTCVYPDTGAVTYDITGYVVDADDGVIGVPGTFFEGDAARIAAAITADLAAGVGEVVKESQFSTTQNSTTGATTKTMTGNAVKAELAGGVNKAASDLRDYLFERVNRVVPFVRVDATRDINVVLLSGTELRKEGSAWTLLFDAEKEDKLRDEKVEKVQRAQEQVERDVANTPRIQK